MTTTTASTFIPMKGRKACYQDEDDFFQDVLVEKIHSRGQLANIVLQSNGQRLLDVPIEDLEAPIDTDVNERFAFFEELTELVMKGDLTSLFCTGEGGIGKSYIIEIVLKRLGLVEDRDFLKIKGHCTPASLFQQLKEWSNRIVIFDDCDSVLKDQISGNILKAILDSTEVRKVKWLSTRSFDKDKEFEFTGSVLFLSNMDISKVESAILSRAVIIDLMMTPSEKIDRMRHVLPSLPAAQHIPMEECEFVLNMIDKYKNTINNLNHRTLIKALKVYHKTKNEGLTRYQILNT